MITISEETKKTFQDRYPEFEDACQAFFRQELPAGQYKGISGKYGSYAERGGNSGMLRMRFSGGRVTKDQIAFLARAIDTYHVQLAHFTTARPFSITRWTAHLFYPYIRNAWSTAFTVSEAAATIPATSRPALFAA